MLSTCGGSSPSGQKGIAERGEKPLGREEPVADLLRGAASLRLPFTDAEEPQEGSGTFCSRTWPRATGLPSSARVMITCHSCWLLPCMIGSATTSTRPSFIGRRKSVVLLTPTANCPLSSTAAEAPRLAALSTAAAYTPPCTTPQGVWCCSSRSIQPRTSSPPISSIRRPEIRRNSL